MRVAVCCVRVCIWRDGLICVSVYDCSSVVCESVVLFACTYVRVFGEVLVLCECVVRVWISVLCCSNLLVCGCVCACMTRVWDAVLVCCVGVRTFTCL